MPSLALNTGYPSLPVCLQDKKASVLKHIAQSGHLVAVHPASRLEVRPTPEMVSTGIVELDTLVAGIPRGCVTEICGTPSSGKTSVLLATIASATRQGEACVLIDASDSFDPGSGAAAGVEFNKLLWIRCGRPLSSVVGRRSLAKNRPTGLPRPSASFAEDGAFDFTDDARPKTDDQESVHKKFHRSYENRLAQVLKSTDLILQSGGFGLVVIDLAGIPEQFVRRIPLASWFRFQRAVERTKTALLVVSEIVCAQTCAAQILKLSAISPFDSAQGKQPPGKPSHAQLLKEMQIEAAILHSRLERKPMQSVKTNFSTQAVRAG
jgi:recombination protein RecA